MKPLRFAVLGGGHLGRIHARLLKSQDQVELVGIADPLDEVRSRLAEEFGVPTCADPAELFPRIDAAIVATPTEHHHRVTCDLLARGIHVFVEKPLTTSAILADELVNLARAQQRILQVGHVERFNPAWRAVTRYLHRPRWIDAARTSGYAFRSTDIGVVLDLMIHDLDLVLATVRSDLMDVTAVGGPVLGPHEDWAHAHLRFANGCMASLKACRTSFQVQRTMQVLTDCMFVGVDFGAGTAKVIRPKPEVVRGQVNVDQLTAAEKDHLKAHMFSELLPMEDIPVVPRNAIADEQSEFIHCIRHGLRPTVPGEQARHCLAVAERILACIDENTQSRPGLLPASAEEVLSPSWWRKAG